MTGLRFHPAGEAAVAVELGNEISPEANARVRRFCRAVESSDIPGVLELVPAYCSVLVLYHPGMTSYRRLVGRLKKAAGQAEESGREERRVFHIPVCYDGIWGEDLEEVASRAGLYEDEVVSLHSAPDYLIYMLGFLPGFAYLGGLDPALVTPRLSTPRLKIPAGSVGIGGEQTGIYPFDSPGGWRIIGRTPLRLYDAGRDPAILYRAGDIIRFRPIEEEEYHTIRRKVEDGTYQVEMEVRKG